MQFVSCSDSYWSFYRGRIIRKYHMRTGIPSGSPLLRFPPCISPVLAPYNSTASCKAQYRIDSSIQPNVSQLDCQIFSHEQGELLHRDAGYRLACKVFPKARSSKRQSYRGQPSIQPHYACYTRIARESHRNDRGNKMSLLWITLWITLLTHSVREGIK